MGQKEIPVYKSEKDFLKICKESLDKMTKAIENTPEEERDPQWWGHMTQVLREIRCYIDYSEYNNYGRKDGKYE